MKYPTTPERITRDRRPHAVPYQATAAEALDIALIPFIRPGTPVTHDPIAARLRLHDSRRAALVATAVNGAVS